MSNNEEIKFHINKAGKPAQCNAKVRACPLGGEHYDTLTEATDRAYIKNDSTNEASRVYTYAKIFNNRVNRPGDGERMAQAYKYAFCEAYNNWSSYSLNSVHKDMEELLKNHMDKLTTDELKSIASITKPMENNSFKLSMAELKNRDKFVRFLGEASIRGDRDVKQSIKNRDGGGFGGGSGLTDTQRTNLRTISILAAT